MSPIRYPIKLAEHRSGVSHHLIRMWEKRYGAITPDRTGTNRRLYTDEEIERLRLLRLATDAGHRIGNIARLSDDDLRKLIPSSETPKSPIQAPPANTAIASRDEGREDLAIALDAIRNMDARAMRDVLDRAHLALGLQGLLARFVSPLAQQIGDAWHRGELRPAHEHFATAALQTYLLGQTSSFADSSKAPTLVAATPTGQLHDLGAVLVAAAARNVGWHAIYLGPSLPAAEIAGAAVQARAQLVALSIVYPPDDPGLPAELGRLRQLLPAEIEIVVGGRDAGAYQDALDRIPARRIDDLDELVALLEATRRRPAR